MYKQLFILFLLTNLVSTAHADAFAEKETLARLANEILAIEPLVREAERRRSPGSSAKFQYNTLRGDLAKIRHGIEAYINQSNSHPRLQTAQGRVSPLRRSEAMRLLPRHADHPDALPGGLL